jgi:hypothetical protein
MQLPRQNTTKNTQLRPTISGLGQIGRLARIRNEYKTIPNLNPDIVNDHAQTQSTTPSREYKSSTP